MWIENTESGIVCALDQDLRSAKVSEVIKEVRFGCGKEFTVKRKLPEPSSDPLERLAETCKSIRLLIQTG